MCLLAIRLRNTFHISVYVVAPDCFVKNPKMCLSLLWHSFYCCGKLLCIFNSNCQVIKVIKLALFEVYLQHSFLTNYWAIFRFWNQVLLGQGSWLVSRFQYSGVQNMARSTSSHSLQVPGPPHPVFMQPELYSHHIWRVFWGLGGLKVASRSEILRPQNVISEGQ